MSHLPVIVGFGGINCAGRTSFHHGYLRLVFDKLSKSLQTEMFMGLSTLMRVLKFNEGQFLDGEGISCTPDDILDRFSDVILKNTLLRRIGVDLFDADHVPCNKKMRLNICNGESVSFTVSRRELPNQIPANWKVEDISGDSGQVKVTFNGELDLFLPDERKMQVQTGGQLPTGFDPAEMYNSKHHPRGLQMALFAITDAINSLGMGWNELKKIVAPDLIGVYASSGMGQLDATGNGGMMKAGVLGQRTSSKQLAMGLAQMPADFINAYVLGNLGHTSAQIGACATFLYNLSAAVRDIQLGKRKIAIVGNSEAPLIPEIYEGYRAMSALGEDSKLLKLDKNNQTGIPDYRTACRPFSENCGFSLSESAQYFVLFDDELAVETGAQVFGAVGDVFINADGYKKSISSPGFGNYISLSKAAGFTRSVIGEESLRHRTFVSAHGTGTPQNRTTESHGLNAVAKSFNIEKWPVSAIKCYLGHSLGAASGDQLAAVLGTWSHGLIPGIFTLDSIAEDVHQSHLHFSQEHIEVDNDTYQAAFINSKGFGGNNATGVILSPQVALDMLEQKHGRKKIQTFQNRQEKVKQNAMVYDSEAIKGHMTSTYIFGENVLDETHLDLNDRKIKVPGFDQAVNLDVSSPYTDMDIRKEN